MADPSIVRFRQVLQVALRELEARREEINELNVYPVADGDTGDNMVRTMQAVLQALDHLERGARHDPSRDEIVEAVRQSALLGARGNSGAITSQIVRGAAEVLATRPGRLVDPQLLCDALVEAARAAREAVSDPTEGTILTAIDEMAKAAAAQLSGRPASVGRESSGVEQNAALAEMLGVVLAAGERAVRRSPEQLDVLAEAKTVDAGAHALVVLVRGLIAGLAGDDAGLPELPHYPPAHVAGLEHADSRYRWCLNLIVRGSGLTTEPPTELAGLGDSLEVVGDEQLLRVHIHTDDPDRVETMFADRGEVHVDSCDDMHIQVAARAARARAQIGAAIVAIANGRGFAEVFAGLGAEVIDGGPTLSPSTAEILAAIEAAPGSEVVVLPNSPNVVLAAEEAARTSPKHVVVVSCLSPQAGAEALVEVNGTSDADELAAAIGERLRAIRTAAVAPAAREDAAGRFDVGDALGIVDGEVIASGEPASTLRDTVAAIANGVEILTLFVGDNAPLGREQVMGLLPEELEAEVHDGGQSNYWWLIAAQ